RLPLLDRPVPGIADCDVRKFAGVVSADLTAPLLMARKYFVPGFLIREFTCLEPFRRTKDCSRLAGPTIPAVSQTHEGIGILNPHALEHLNCALRRRCAGAKKGNREPQVVVKFAPKPPCLVRRSDIAWFANENAWP